MLEDIAILSGGQAISEDLGIKIANVTLDMLGRARCVEIERENPVIVGGVGKTADINGRVAQIKAPTTTARSFLRTGVMTVPSAVLG